MTTSTASIRTAHGSRYLQQLAKHWSHKFPVEFTPAEAAIDLPLGRCALQANGDALEVKLTGGPDTDFDRFEQVVVEHLQRFGHREELEFAWRRS